MRQTPAQHRTNTRPIKYRTVALAIAAAALLSACGSPGGGKQDQDPTPIIEQSQQNISEAGSHNLPDSEFSQQFLHAEQSLFEFDWMAAESTLATVSDQELSLTDGQYIAYLRARIAYLRGDQTSAKQQLEALVHTTQNAAIRHRVMSFQRYMDSLSGDYLASAQTGDQLLRLAPSETESDSLRRNIWKDLMRVEASQIQSGIAASTDQQWLGWLEVAQIGRGTLGSPMQLQALQQWRSRYPQHPAAAVLPGGMNYLLESPQQPKRVALLLPLSGRLAPAARAVRDGYLAEYYAAGDSKLQIDITDILAYGSITEAYHSAVAGGADFVVGPLSKQAVTELGNLSNRQVPVLALNRIDQTLPPGDTALVQLALAPEDEAEQIADLAFGRGARQALVIRPAGSWGAKMEQALKKQWQKLGGTLSATATYSSREDYSNSMSAAMNIPASEQRSRGVRSMLATNVEFTARRRQDLDVVFLLSKSGVEARSLKPLLAYHYASDLPVYASSNIYRGSADSRDQDLNGINLVEIPWLLGANNSTRAAVSRGDIGSGAYTRLNALGADAYLLQSNFSALQAGDDMLLRANTGLLSLNPQLQIHRELQKATFDGGKLVAQ